MNNSELQEEEKEVLLSIYDGDPAFKQMTPTVYQYKVTDLFSEPTYGEDGSSKSLLLEVSWGENYPSEKPAFNMDTFYNNQLSVNVKDNVIKYLNEEAEQWLESPMTYTLFEGLKEKFDEFISLQEEAPPLKIEDAVSKLNIEPENVKKETVPKEHLSKAQKRKMWDRVDNKGEKPRGWNWVDIIKHLSQSGMKEPNPVS